jgi:hypothetical protein
VNIRSDSLFMLCSSRHVTFLVLAQVAALCSKLLSVVEDVSQLFYNINQLMS